MADAVTVLHEEIATFEEQISKRRQALTILTGAPTPTKSPAAKSPAAKSPAVKSPAVKSFAAKSPAVKSPAVKSFAAKSPAVKSPAVKSPAVKSPAPRPSTVLEGPSLVARIVTHLSANKGQMFTSAQITEALGKTDKSVRRDNVQRRLSDLFSRKQVSREDGRYGVA